MTPDEENAVAAVQFYVNKSDHFSRRAYEDQYRNDPENEEFLKETETVLALHMHAHQRAAIRIITEQHFDNWLRRKETNAPKKISEYLTKWGPFEPK